jgi:hypothetical protein
MDIIAWQEKPLIPPHNGGPKPHIYHVINAGCSPQGTFDPSRKREVPSTEEYSSVRSKDKSRQITVICRTYFKEIVAWYAVDWPDF